MMRHDLGEATVVPVIVRSCDWESSRFGKLQALPVGAKPIQNWRPQDDGWTDVAKGIRELVKKLVQAKTGAFEKIPDTVETADPDVSTIEIATDQASGLLTTQSNRDSWRKLRKRSAGK